MTAEINLVQLVEKNESRQALRPQGFETKEVFGKGNPHRVEVFKGVSQKYAMEKMKNDHIGTTSGKFETGESFGI